MPLGPGGYDSNGIWLYGEDDSEALASDLLNLGMQSVSDAISGGLGAILQVVSTTKTDTSSASMAGGASASTGLSASITPSSTSSKILVRTFANVAHEVTYRPAIALKRDSTQIAIGASDGNRTLASSSGQIDSDVGLVEMSQEFLDSPSTTSPVTYSLDFVNISGLTRTMYLNRTIDDANSTGIPRVVSTITLMEVAA
jgi:hypothetical protein